MEKLKKNSLTWFLPSPLKKGGSVFIAALYSQRQIKAVLRKGTVLEKAAL